MSDHVDPSGDATGLLYDRWPGLERGRRGHGWTGIPNALFDLMAEFGLSPGAQLLAIHLLRHDHWRTPNEVTPGRATLARMMGVSERQVGRYRAELTRAGLIEVRTWQDGAAWRSLTDLKPLKAAVERRLCEGTASAQEGTASAQEGGPAPTPVGTAPAPEGTARVAYEEGGGRSARRGSRRDEKGSGASAPDLRVTSSPATPAESEQQSNRLQLDEVQRLLVQKARRFSSERRSLDDFIRECSCLVPPDVPSDQRLSFLEELWARATEEEGVRENA